MKREKIQNYLFVVVVYSIFGLEPKSSQEQYDLNIDVWFQKMAKQFECSSNSKCVYMNQIITEELEFYNNLEFENNFHMVVKNNAESKKKLLQKLFSSSKDDEIGSLQIQAKKIHVIEDLNNLKISPKFYNLLKDQQIKGKVLADFQLIKMVRKGTILQQQIKQQIELKYKNYQIDFSCIGLRHISEPLLNPIIQVKIKELSFELEGRPEESL